jgi:hypothetical protein
MENKSGLYFTTFIALKIALDPRKAHGVFPQIDHTSQKASMAATICIKDPSKFPIVLVLWIPSDFLTLPCQTNNFILMRRV